jgi:hypothetical protein
MAAASRQRIAQASLEKAPKISGVYLLAQNSAMGYCRVTKAPINLVSGDLSCIKPQHETTGRHFVSIGGWTGHVLASVLFQPLHDASPLEIVHALSLRDWRHPLADADHAGFFRDAIGVFGAAPLTFILACHRSRI